MGVLFTALVVWLVFLVVSHGLVLRAGGESFSRSAAPEVRSTERSSLTQE